MAHGIQQLLRGVGFGETPPAVLVQGFQADALVRIAAGKHDPDPGMVPPDRFREVKAVAVAQDDIAEYQVVAAGIPPGRARPRQAGGNLGPVTVRVEDPLGDASQFVHVLDHQDPGRPWATSLKAEW